MTLKLIICPVCEALFIATMPNRKTCSAKCRFTKDEKPC